MMGESAADTCQKQMLFIEIYSFVLERLKIQFEKFKRSPNFVALEEDIKR